MSIQRISLFTKRTASSLAALALLCGPALAEWPKDKLIVVWDGASYHRACVVREAAEALQIDLVPLPRAEECCGFGGTFALKNAETSVAMGSDKASHVRSTGAEVLVAGDSSCLMHMGGLLDRQRGGVRTMHLAEVLAATEGQA